MCLWLSQKLAKYFLAEPLTILYNIFYSLKLREEKA